MTRPIPVRVKLADDVSHLSRTDEGATVQSVVFTVAAIVAMGLLTLALLSARGF